MDGVDGGDGGDGVDGGDGGDGGDFRSNAFRRYPFMFVVTTSVVLLVRELLPRHEEWGRWGIAEDK
ncbi:hypothetical protein NG791_10140 [Laspinema sp. D1]|uniref:hypothetical protein n=1 Tax=Laspinema palackyanum TaxID=3231601 RepID=UPI003486A029|nr:hypothetical protein [Laspinema sp. D2b]